MKERECYTVREISEDLDFGCEERPAEAPRMAVVTLTDQNGLQTQVRQPDELLYDRGIEEGDCVWFDSDGGLRKHHIITIEEIENNLRAMADEKNAAFQRKLTPGIAPERFLGTRIPALRAYAKELTKQSPDGCAAFLEALPHPYYDEDLLHAILLGQMKEFGNCLIRTVEFLPYINNWAVCDTLRPAVFKKNTEKLLPYVRKWIASKETYTCRFGVGMLLSYYLDDVFAPEYLALPAAISSEEYYVNMMIAWYYATALAKQWESTIPYLQENRLPVWVHNKTIQKARESYRITEEQKEYLKGLRRMR